MSHFSTHASCSSPSTHIILKAAACHHGAMTDSLSVSEDPADVHLQTRSISTGLNHLAAHHRCTSLSTNQVSIARQRTLHQNVADPACVSTDPCTDEVAAICVLAKFAPAKRSADTAIQPDCSDDGVWGNTWTLRSQNC